MRKISSDHYGSSGINCELYNWLPVVASGSWIFQKIVSCVSSNIDVIMTEIEGFYDLTMTIDLLPLLLTENIGIAGRLFRN